MNAADITKLVKRFGALTAVDQVSFAVEPGQVVALLGPNGSGKTTCLRCVAGLLQPSAGGISVGGYDLHRQYRAARRQFSYLPQQASFPANLRVGEVLQFHASLRQLPQARINQALTSAGLAASDAQRMAGQLSGGMRQRVSLAVACLAEAPLLLLDEPTANLDPQAAINFRMLARDWRAAGRSILLSTHVLTDVEELADKVVVLVEGRKVAEEGIAQLRARLNRWSRLRVDVGSPQPEHCAAALSSGATEAKCNSHAVVVAAPAERRMAILERLREIGEIHRFNTEQPSLEDIYLEYIRGHDAHTP